MGFALIKKNSPKNGYDSHAIVEIMIDTKEDLQNLPVGFDAGSIAYTADRSVSATLNTKGEWVVHVGENGGGSSGGFTVHSEYDENYVLTNIRESIDDIYNAINSNKSFKLESYFSRDGSVRIENAHASFNMLNVDGNTFVDFVYVAGEPNWAMVAGDGMLVLHSVWMRRDGTFGEKLRGFEVPEMEM